MYKIFFLTVFGSVPPWYFFLKPVHVSESIFMNIYVNAVIFIPKIIKICLHIYQYGQLSLIQTSVIWNIHIPAWFFWNQISSSIFYHISLDIHVPTVDISIWNNWYHLLYKCVHQSDQDLNFKWNCDHLRNIQYMSSCCV